MDKKKAKDRAPGSVKPCLGHYRLRISDRDGISRLGFRDSTLRRFALASVLLSALIFVLAVCGTAAAQTLTVSVADQSSTPIEGVKIYLYTQAGAYAGRNATTDAAGGAQLGDADTLTAGSYSPKAVYLGQEFWGRAFDLPGGADQSLTIDMAEVGVTVSYAGQPAAGVKIYLFSGAGTYLSVNQLTDANGQGLFILPVGRDFKVRADILGTQYYSPVFQPQSGGSAVAVQAGGGQLQVTLQKAAGSPMAGIKLYLFNTAGAYLGRQLTSDSAGQALFAVPQGDYRIRADYLGYQFWSQDVNVAADSTLAFTIAHQDITFTLSGQYDTPAPLAGVHLYLFTQAGSYVGINQSTDTAGTIHLQLPDQPYKIRADYLNQQYWSDPFQFADAGLILPLAQVDLTVVWNGMPLENVPVYLFTGTGTYTGIQHSTDATGRISYQLPQAQWQFRADYQTNQYWATADNPPPGQVTPVTLSTGGGTLNFGVTLYQNDNQVLAGIKCYVFNDQGTYTGVNGTTDAQGRVAFDLAAGSYQIRVDYLGYQFWSELYNLTADASDVFHIPHQQVTLTVNGLFDTPVPLSDIQVSLFNAAGDYLNQQQGTDANGQVVFNLPEKAYKARVDYLGQQYWSAEFDSPNPVLNIPLARPDVNVFSASQGLADLTVYAYNQDDTFVGISGVTNAQGQIIFELPVGQYKFKTTSLGHTFWSDPVDLTAAGTPYVPINVGGGSFTLTALKDVTTPLANTKCFLFNSDGTQYLGQWASTDEYGQASFDLVDGSFSFRLDHLGYQFFTPAYQVPDTLAETMTIAHQDLPITVNGVLDSAQPLENVKVYLFSAAGAYLGQQQTTPQNGIVTFQLPARDYKVRADYMGYQFWSPVFNSQPVDLQIPLSRAEVTVKGIGQPLENVPVYAFTGAGAYLGMNLSTDGEGKSRFTLPADQPYKFRADYQGSQFWSEAGSLDAAQDTPVLIDTGGGQFALSIQKDAYSPLADLKCYVYTGQQAYIGTFGTSDAQGKLTFALADGDYTFKVVYAGDNFWTPVISVPAALQHTLTIAHSRKTIHVQAINPGPQPIAGAKAYVYTEAGAYIGLTADTDASGRVLFDLPGQAYKVKIAYNGQNYWTGLLAGASAVVSINQDAGAVPAAVEGLSAGVAGANQIDLSWSAPADTTGLAGYAVYRRSVCDDSFVRLNATLTGPAATGYSDTTVSGPGGLAYYVAAVNDQGLEGLPSAVVIADPGGSSPGQNTSTVTNLAATWNQDQARLSWDNQAGLRYQIYRGLDPAALTPYRCVDAAPFDDPASDPAATYYYQVATIERRCDPASGQPLDLPGPLSALVTLGPRSNAVASTDLPINSQGQYLITTGAGSGYSLQGSYSGMSGDVVVTATLGDITVNGTGTDGHFSIDLPQAGNWQITISQADGGSSTTIDTVWQIDDQPPSLSVDGPAGRSTAESQITITGLAADAQSALQGVYIASDRYPGPPFGATIDAMGSFSAQVPLKIGDNILTVTASDIHNNSTDKNVTVTQTLTALPVVQITSPADGAVVTTERIAVSGTVRSSLPPEQIRLLLNDQVIFPEGSDNLYSFTFDNVSLATGSNLLTVRAETAYGNVSAQTTVQYGSSEGPAETAKLQIQVLWPLPDTYLAAAAVVTGLVSGPAAITAVTVNGLPADQVAGLGTPQASFKSALSLPGSDAPITITIGAQDAAGQSASLTYSVHADVTAPVISLANGNLQPPPAVNTVTQSPYAVSGSIVEKNMAGLTINDQPVPLSPAAAADTYAFSAGLPLTYGSEQTVAIEAWDLAGNRTGTQWIVTLSSNLNIEVIAPPAGAQLEGQSDTLDVGVTVRVPGAAADDRFLVSADGGTAVELTRAGTVGNGTVSIALAQEDHQLAVSVENSAGSVIAATGSSFSTRDMRNVPLAVDEIKPANGAEGIEPNDFIALYFNKEIDPALLQIEVLETAHGKTYPAAAQGADMTRLSAVSLEEVHRDREPVPGGVSLLPGNKMAAFYPSRDLAYGAEVFIDATYDGSELLRATYKVRPLPTLIEGFVTDSASNPLAGIEVKIDRLDRSAVTNSDGAYSFGFGMDVADSVPAGRHKLIINPGMQNSAYGTLTYWARANEGLLSSVPPIKLPVISPQIPFRRIISGRAENILAGGALKLDLSAAQLGFADLRNQGDVHVQFLSVEQLPYAPLAYATPLWMFCVQPGGVAVSGQVGLSMAIPARQGSYTYLEQFGQLVVLVGLDPEALMLVPVGVGRIDLDTKTVVSQGAVHLQRLDFIGYAHMTDQFQPLLQEYVDGTIELQELIAGLQNGQ